VDFLVIYGDFFLQVWWLVGGCSLHTDIILGVGVQEGSAILSNANLGVRGQGRLELQGAGDAIMAQRLFVSLFFNVIVRHSSHQVLPLIVCFYSVW
jgi:hypothetical protein